MVDDEPHERFAVAVYQDAFHRPSLLEGKVVECLPRRGYEPIVAILIQPTHFADARSGRAYFVRLSENRTEHVVPIGDAVDRSLQALRGYRDETAHVEGLCEQPQFLAGT